MTVRAGLPRGTAGAAGFTLLELIVAASILALIAVFSWRGLDSILREREAIASAQAALDGLSRAFARIERDGLLARDAEVDEDGTLRLVARTTTEPGAASVEYRLRDGTLVRRVNDGSPPIALLDGIASIGVEAWVPGQGGGWVRTKGRAIEAPVPGTPSRAPGQPGAPGMALAGTSAAASTSTTTGAMAAGATGTPRAGNAPAPLLVSAATGFRVAIARPPQQAPIVRAFLIGSGG